MTTEQILLLISMINICLIDIVLLTTFIIIKIFDKTHKDLENVKDEEDEHKKK